MFFYEHGFLGSFCAEGSFEAYLTQENSMAIVL